MWKTFTFVEEAKTSCRRQAALICARFDNAPLCVTIKDISFLAEGFLYIPALDLESSCEESYKLLFNSFSEERNGYPRCVCNPTIHETAPQPEESSPKCSNSYWPENREKKVSRRNYNAISIPTFNGSSTGQSRLKHTNKFYSPCLWSVSSLYK